MKPLHSMTRSRMHIPRIEALAVHGGLLGKTASLIGLEAHIKDMNNDSTIDIPKIPYNFFKTSITRSALSLVTQYAFKDPNSLKIVIGHSMGADILGRVYGYHGKYRYGINPIDPPLIDLLVSLFPLSQEVKYDYTKKMSSKAKRVLFIFLEKEESIVWHFRSYKRALKVKTTLPDNVRIAKIEGKHAGGFTHEDLFTTKNVMQEIKKEIELLCQPLQQ